jgi:ferredoxin/flavodoxin
MKTTIFYFSATGNCLVVARDLAKELGNATLVNIAQVIDQELDLSADCIGIIYPVYVFGMPSIITRFINKLKSYPNKYFFAITTGGSIAADTLGKNARLFGSCGLKLSSGFFIRMPGNYTPMYGARSLAEQTKLFAKEKRKIKEIAGIVSQKKVSRIERANILFNLYFSGLIYRLIFPRLAAFDKHFWADHKCNSCGVCVKVCPVENVSLLNGRPKWMHKCEQCMACLQWCPEEAIQFSKMTLKRKRYRNPDVKLADIILK